MSTGDHIDQAGHEVDMFNVTFGAALGGYVGIVIATENIPTYQVWILCGILAALGLLLISVRDIARSQYGESYVGLRHPWNITFAVLQIGLIQVLAYEIPVAAEKFSIILRAWALVLAVSLVTGFIRAKRKSK